MEIFEMKNRSFYQRVTACGHIPREGLFFQRRGAAIEWGLKERVQWQERG